MGFVRTRFLQGTPSHFPHGAGEGVPCRSLRLLVVLALCAALVGCGAPKDGESQDAPANAPAAPAPAPVDVPTRVPSTEADKNAIRVGIAEALEPLADPSKRDTELLTATISQEELDYLQERCGLDVGDVLAHALRGFSYAIGEVSVGVDGHASATVSVRSLDLAAARDAVMRRVVEADESASLEGIYRSEDEDAPYQIIRHVFDLLGEELDRSDAYRTTEVELTLTRADGVWTLDAGCEQAIADAIGMR